MRLINILYFFVLVFLFLSCRKKEMEVFHYDRKVIVVFAPEGIETNSASGLIYQGLYRATDSLNLVFRSIIPSTYDEGLDIIKQLTATDKEGLKRLVVVADPMYVDDLDRDGSLKKMLDTDSTKVLILGPQIDYSNIYNAYVSPYGLMYKSGYIAGSMEDVDSVKLYVATNKSSYHKEAYDGFIAGYNRTGKGMLSVDNIGEELGDERIGFYMMDDAYCFKSHEIASNYDLLMPICGETIMGFLRYNRENPGSFYTIGVDYDMSVYSEDVPYSCISYWNKVAMMCVDRWNREDLGHMMIFGLEDYWSEIIFSEIYKKDLYGFSEEIHYEAITKEKEYKH